MLNIEALSTPSGLVGLFVLLALLPLVYYIVILALWTRRMKRIGKTVDLFPGPPTHWLYGNLHQHPGFNEKGLAYFADLARKHKKAFRFWFGPLRPAIIVHHPDTAKIVLRSTEPKQLSGGGGYSLIRSWLGDGLLLSSGSKWFRNRRLLTPAFHFDVLKPYMKVYNEAADLFLDKIEEDAKLGSVEICQPVSLLTLNIILRCAFSSDMDVQRQGNPIMYIDTLYYLTSNGREYKKNLDLAHQTSRDVIKQRKQVLKDNPDSAKKRYLDFLDILLLARDECGEGLTDGEIQAEVDTFLFEGHDTTASAISWILYELARNPDHQQTCREEVNTCFSGLPTAEVTWDDLTKLNHTTMCIKEAIRIHSPVPLIGRETSKPLELEGVLLPPGTLVDVSMPLMHHNEDVWGDDHMEFKPERFHPDRLEEMDSFSFVPFSAGPRNCIGQNFAMHEIKVVVSKLLNRFVMHLDPDHKVEHKPEVVMRATYGIKVLFTLVGDND